MLDLARVGSGAGLDIELIAHLHAAFADLELLAGGGVRDIEDLRALDAAGGAGALVATALHGGVIGPRELADLHDSPLPGVRPAKPPRRRPSPSVARASPASR